MIFDTHAHYDDEDYNVDRDGFLKSLKENKVDLIMNVGASLKTTENTVKLTKEYDFIYGAAGVHPTETLELEDESLYKKLREYALMDKIMAVGEIGLDYYWDKPSKEIQKKHFEIQLDLAKEIKKPVIIHSRDAALDTYEMMKSLDADTVGGIVHCFSYGKEMARDFLNLGFYLGIGGVITFKNAKKLREVVEYMPLDRLVLETDAPYLTPEPFRGKRNSSGYLVYVAEKIAEIKNISVEEVFEITYKNGLEVYNINWR